jgi:hypothetical protein
MPPSKRVQAAEDQFALVMLLAGGGKGHALWRWHDRLEQLVNALDRADEELREVAEEDPWVAEQVSAARLQTTEALKRTNKLLNEVKRCLV